MKTKLRFLFGLIGAALLLPCGLIVVMGLQDDMRPSDVAVVLGSKVNPDGSLSPRLKARLDAALMLYRNKLVPFIITSGGTGVEGHDEAAVMADYLYRQGVPKASILVDSSGIDTRATALATAALVKKNGFRSVTAVSQYFHLPRTQLALQQCGIANVRTVHAAYWEARDLYSLIREVPGYASYWSKGCKTTQTAM